jgi:hypothetical protein
MSIAVFTGCAPVRLAHGWSTYRRPSRPIPSPRPAPKTVFNRAFLGRGCSLAIGSTHCARRNMQGGTNGTPQIPIALLRPERRTSRDFVPWRLPNAGPRCSWSRPCWAGIRNPSHKLSSRPGQRFGGGKYDRSTAEGCGRGSANSSACTDVFGSPRCRRRSAAYFSSDTIRCECLGGLQEYHSTLVESNDVRSLQRADKKHLQQSSGSNFVDRVDCGFNFSFPRPGPFPHAYQRPYQGRKKFACSWKNTLICTASICFHKHGLGCRVWKRSFSD